MANHKRKRPKHQRMGCSCKYWKDERENKHAKYMTKPSEFRRTQFTIDDLEEEDHDLESRHSIDGDEPFEKAS